MRFLIMSPASLLDILELAAGGDKTPEDLMMTALDSALENPVNLTMEEDEDDA